RVTEPRRRTLEAGSTDPQLSPPRRARKSAPARRWRDSAPRHFGLATRADRHRPDRDAGLALDPLEIVARPGGKLAPAAGAARVLAPAGEAPPDPLAAAEHRGAGRILE